MFVEQFVSDMLDVASRSVNWAVSLVLLCAALLMAVAVLSYLFSRSN